MLNVPKKTKRINLAIERSIKSILQDVIILLSVFFAVSEETNAQAWLWAKSIGGSGDDYGRSIAVDPINGERSNHQRKCGDKKLIKVKL